MFYEAKESEYVAIFALGMAGCLGGGNSNVSKGIGKPLTTSQLGLKDGMKMKINDVLENAEKFLGQGYKDIWGIVTQVIKLQEFPCFF
ncbi:hypothetical protein [Paenibacillus spiritus]|uniref:hypothetical protein n=1 Tax=Paenibacillus spiritus TaxID=2496557 RepID=UPI00123E2527|nr:hypothetical protein [Paenibacillus spiritus]